MFDNGMLRTIFAAEHRNITGSWVNDHIMTSSTV
jgi:hypothetical protein